MAARSWSRALALVATAAGAIVSSAAAQQRAGGTAAAGKGPPHACSLLTKAEIDKLIIRGRPTYGDNVPDAMSIRGGTLCSYPLGGQVFLFSGPKSPNDLEFLIRNFKRDKEKRYPVSNLGDRAWIMFATPRNQYEDVGPFLAVQKGLYTVAVTLAAEKSPYEGAVKDACESGQMDAADCAKIKAKPFETPQSLQPAATELARAVLAKLP